MAIEVNKELCIGCSACASVCPESFQMESDGKAGVVSQDMKDCTKEASKVCPVQAITVS